MIEANQMNSVLDALDNAATTDEEIFELAVGIGVDAAKDGDKNKFLIGDLANAIVTRYGKNTIETFAAAINVKSASVYEYKKVCEYYPRNSVRTELLEELPTLTYTHLKIAKGLKELDASLEFLTDCHNNHWRTEQAYEELRKLQGKPPRPRKLLGAHACIVTKDQTTGDILIRVDKGAVSFDPLPLNTEIVIRIFEVAA